MSQGPLGSHSQACGHSASIRGQYTGGAGVPRGREPSRGPSPLAASEKPRGPCKGCSARTPAQLPTAPSSPEGQGSKVHTYYSQILWLQFASSLNFIHNPRSTLRSSWALRTVRSSGKSERPSLCV